MSRRKLTDSSPGSGLTAVSSAELSLGNRTAARLCERMALQHTRSHSAGGVQGIESPDVNAWAHQMCCHDTHALCSAGKRPQSSIEWACIPRNPRVKPLSLGSAANTASSSGKEIGATRHCSCKCLSIPSMPTQDMWSAGRNTSSTDSSRSSWHAPNKAKQPCTMGGPQ